MNEDDPTIQEFLERGTDMLLQYDLPVLGPLLQPLLTYLEDSGAVPVVVLSV